MKKSPIRQTEERCKKVKLHTQNNLEPIQRDGGERQVQDSSHKHETACTKASPTAQDQGPVEDDVQKKDSSSCTGQRRIIMLTISSKVGCARKNYCNFFFFIAVFLAVLRAPVLNKDDAITTFHEGSGHHTNAE